MKIEVVYALPHRQYLLTLEVAEKATVADAISATTLLAKYPEIDLHSNPLGIFGKKVDLQQPLFAGDRVEIYRPLTVDPKMARRIRAAKR